MPSTKPIFTQDHRPIRITTSLGKDALLLSSMQGAERLGRLSEYQVELLSADPDIFADKVLGTTATISIEPEDGGVTRYFHAYFTAFGQREPVGVLFRYRATLSPWVWFLTQSTDNRIFQNLSVLEIIKCVFNESKYASIANFDVQSLSQGDYKAREYCVQYRETDFEFISRLMESEGIYYYFRHAANSHQLVLADSIAAHKTIDGYDQLPFDPSFVGDYQVLEGFRHWNAFRTVAGSAVSYRDFDFKQPRKQLQVSAPRVPGKADAEYYEFATGRFDQIGEGVNRARKQFEARQADDSVASGEGYAYKLTTGGLFGLIEHPSAEQNTEYLIIATDYDLHAGPYQTVGIQTDGAPTKFTCQVQCIPSRRPYRSALVTTKPVIHGPQTAIVVGPQTEQVHTDEYGRVKVQFHWDRLGNNNENSSCWVRVAQSSAGNRWGAVFLPRVGHEVVVSFLDGDPDQPLITGSVYNGDNRPPYALPGERTKSTIKTKSTNSNGFNELRFEDKQGAEELFLHAERDFRRVVENNDYLEVGAGKKSPGDQSVNIHNDQTISVGQTSQLKAGKRRVIEVGGSAVTVDMQSDGSCVIDASKSITLTVGESSIKLEPGKITVSSPQIAMKSSGVMAIQAGGVLNLKGTLVKIN